MKPDRREGPAPDEPRPEGTGEEALDPRLQERLDMPPPNLTESMDLVEKAKGGDEDALNDLLARYQDRVLRVVRIRLGSRLRRHLESMDIVNETLATASRNIERLDTRDNPASILQWLAKIAEHKIKDYNDYFTALKRDKRREVPLEVPAPGGEGETVERDLEGELPRPDDLAILDEIGGLIDEALTELSDDHREVILLRDYLGGEWDFVAREMGRGDNVHATQELHRRARKKLEEKLRPRLGEDED